MHIGLRELVQHYKLMYTDFLYKAMEYSGCQMTYACVLSNIYRQIYTNHPFMISAESVNSKSLCVAVDSDIPRRDNVGARTPLKQIIGFSVPSFLDGECNFSNIVLLGSVTEGFNKDMEAAPAVMDEY